MQKLAIRLIYWYQKNISVSTIPKCRYHPTCSAYALICFNRFHAIKALYLSIKRLLRCNPLFRGKYDPPPMWYYRGIPDEVLFDIKK